MRPSRFGQGREAHGQGQYTVNTNGLIIHNTRHSPGRVQVRVYRMKHPTFPSGLPSRDGSDGKKGKTKVRVLYGQGLPGGAEDVRRGGSDGTDQAEARKKALGARATGSTNYTAIQSRRFPAAACSPSPSRHDGAKIRGVGRSGVSGQAVRVLELNLVATSSFLCQIGLLVHKIIFSGISDMSA